MCCNRAARQARQQCARPRRESRLVTFFRAYQAHLERKHSARAVNGMSSQPQHQPQPQTQTQIQRIVPIEDAPPSYDSMNHGQAPVRTSEIARSSPSWVDSVSTPLATANKDRPVSTKDDFAEFEAKVMSEARDYVQRCREELGP